MKTKNVVTLAYVVSQVLAVVLAQSCSSLDKNLAAANQAVAQADQAVSQTAAVVGAAVSTAVQAETAATNAVARAEVAEVKAVASVQETHVVVAGDSLWKIDVKHGGDGFGWYGIYKANRDQITDYNVIEPRQQFTWNRLVANTPDNRLMAYQEPVYKKGGK